MEILDAVDVPTGIHGEGDPIQAAMAHHTGEAVGMVGLPGGSENPFHDGLRTDTALLQCVLQIKRTQPHVSAISARHCSFYSQEHESYGARAAACCASIPPSLDDLLQPSYQRQPP